MRKLTNIFVLFLFCSTASAQEANSIKRVEDICLSAIVKFEELSLSKKMDALECMTYLRGLWDGFLQANSFGGKVFCPTQNVSAQDMARLFLSNSVSLPEDVKRLRGSAPALYAQILNVKYQCR